MKNENVDVKSLNLINERIEQIEAYMKGVVDENTKNKLTSIVGNLKEKQKETLEAKNRLLNAVNNDSTNSSLNYYKKELEESVERSDKLINELSSFLDKNKTNFLENLEVVIKNYIDFLSNLNTEQLCNVMTITSSSLILICIFHILIIYFGNFLIDYFRLESKYPRIAKFIRLRKMFQDFNILVNIIVIVIVLMFIIYVNFVTLFN